MKHRLVLVAVATSTIAGIAGCGGQDPATSGTVAITATDSTCDVAKTAFDPGSVTFAVTNKGSRTTEVYVYGDAGGKFTRIVAEVENIGPGITRDLSATLASGRYEIACKPGQTGDGIRTPISVSGTATSATGSGQASAYDREIEVEATPAGVEGADGLSAKAGERIEFKLENKAAGKRELEIINPAGKVVATIEAVGSGTAEAIVTLSEPGTWTLKVEGDGITEIEKTLTVA